MISLADLRARNVQPVWQEAVAVIQELIQTVSTTSSPLPDLEHIALIPNGDVVALPGSSVPSDPVRHAAMMLNILVDGVATPPELEQFLQRNLTSPPQLDSIAEFSRQLSFFERPGRRTDVERLVGRAAAAEQMTRADEELKRLMEKANEATEKPPKEMFEEQRPARRVPTMVAAALLLIGAIALGAFWWRGRSAHPPQQAAVNPAAAATTSDPSAARDLKAQGTDPKAAEAAKPEPSFLEKTAAAVKSAVGALVGSGSAPAATPAPAAQNASATPEKARPHVRHNGNGTAPKIAAAPLAEGNGDTKPATSVELLPMTEDVTAGSGDDANVYTSTDATVIPPVMVRPVLPKEPPPGVPLHQIGTIDVWVDENGDVEQVRLMSPANRYQERMLVSAAKMWKFRPAFKDGHPVRYRTRVRLTV
jgi:hypothetical protein